MNIVHDFKKGRYVMKAKVFVINKENEKFWGYIDYYSLKEGWIDIPHNYDNKIKPYCYNLYTGKNFLTIMDQVKMFLQCDFDYFELYDIIFDSESDSYTEGVKIHTYSKNNEIKKEFTDDILTPQIALKNTQDNEKEIEERLKEYIKN